MAVPFDCMCIISFPLEYPPFRAKAVFCGNGAQDTEKRKKEGQPSQPLKKVCHGFGSLQHRGANYHEGGSLGIPILLQAAVKCDGRENRIF